MEINIRVLIILLCGNFINYSESGDYQRKCRVQINPATTPIKIKHRGETLADFSILSNFTIELISLSMITTNCKKDNHTISTEYHCVEGSIFFTNGKFKWIESLDCVDDSEELDPNPERFTEWLVENGHCYNDFTNIEVIMTNSLVSYKLATICHNRHTSETLYVKSYIQGHKLNETERTKRPAFKEAGFYPELIVNDCYTQAKQLLTLSTLLGSTELANKYIKVKENLFFARGHLFPKADGIESYEQLATFYFVNAVPQWQSINGGNLNILEGRIRQIAEHRRTTLTIYTGSYGITTLNDVNGKPIELWLGRDTTGQLIRRLPVPNLLWKVIHDEVRNEAVAIIMINNPWEASRKETDSLCPTVCNDLPWVTWNVTNQRSGFTYCCDMESFQKVIPYAPRLGSLPLLKERLYPVDDLELFIDIDKNWVSETVEGDIFLD